MSAGAARAVTGIISGLHRPDPFVLEMTVLLRYAAGRENMPGAALEIGL